MGEHTIVMGSLFRSEEMSLLRLYFERGAARATVDELGSLGLVQFRDLNAEQSAFQRAFSANVRQCDDMQRRVRFLLAQIADDATVEAPELGFAPTDYATRAHLLRLDDLDDRLAEHEAALLQMNAHFDALQVQSSQLIELRYVLEKGSEFFSEAPRVTQAAYGTIGIMSSESAPGPMSSIFGEGSGGQFGSTPTSRSALAGDGGEDPTAHFGGGPSTLLSYFAGVVPKSKQKAFERVLFRATRGNCFARFSDIPESIIDPSSSERVEKAAFMVFFSGTEVKTKVAKICNAFNANRYPFPENVDAQIAAYGQCRERLNDLDSVISVSSSQRRALLEGVGQDLALWDEKIRREKAVYHTLNMLNYDTSNSLFIADVWVPKYAIHDVHLALDAGRSRAQAQVPSVLEERAFGKNVPPTHFRTNRFTQVFHSIVESYGVAEYREVNPAPFTIITFPFLFAVMFGDVGHGALMFLFALYVVMNEKRMVRRKLDEFMQTCYDGRYMLLLMGMFSIFTGFIYNECFAVPLDLFGSRWKFTHESIMACGIDNCKDAAAVKAPIHPYPFGFDPIWKTSTTGLMYFNSYKMKLSIVFGVTQMILGICMSYVNAKHFKHPLDVWHVFVPQMIFLNSIFGYLVFLIIVKWATNWDSDACIKDPNCIAPDLKSVLINMFMAPGTFSEMGRLYPMQEYVQPVLLLAALVAVPWMLLPKPLILLSRHNKKKKEEYRPLVDEGETAGLLASEGSINGSALMAPGPESSLVMDGEDEDEDEDFNFADMFVNQMIHTIEFVLGAISNTASYLRLWALSLAHAELSDVFLEKLLYMTIESGSTVLMVVGFFMWIGLTFGVLMFMESLSAFLHALRLHWVEFQNKFYNLHGDGNKFVAFDYKLLGAEE